MARKVKERPVKFKATVVVPIIETVQWRKDWFKHFRPSLVPAISELNSFTAQDLGLNQYKPENLRLKIRKKSKSLKHNLEILMGRRSPLLKCVELEWSVELTLTDLRIEGGDGRPVPLKERISLWTYGASMDFARTVASILVASQIAQPGVLRTDELEIWTGKRFLGRSSGAHGYYGEIVEFAGKKGWPKIENLSVKQVWQWMCCFDPLRENMGKSEIGRALNALSCLLSQKPIGGSYLVDLMWAMIGLEALYGRGTSDLTYQLVEKAGVLLGKSAGFEKAVKEMYRFRSLFVHGKAPFPGALFMSEGMSEYEKHFSEANDSSYLAAAVLIASLQQIAKHNLKSLNFSFVMDEPACET